MKHRVVLADDHWIVREGLAAILHRDPHLEVIAEVGDGEEALEVLQREKPDLAILDVQMPRMSGIEVLRRARELKLKVSAVLLSMHHDRGYVRAALEAGARGYVIKEAAPAELLDAARAVLAGQLFVSARLGLDPIDLLRESPKLTEPTLTPREREVLRLLAQGLSSKEIASRLDLSVRTVDGRRATIMEKLQIRTVPGLVKYALKHHITNMDE